MSKTGVRTANGFNVSYVKVIVNVDTVLEKKSGGSGMQYGGS